jgi:hypothetical protein
MEPAVQNSLPGYRGVLTTIGAAYVLLAVMNVAQGLSAPRWSLSTMSQDG